MTTVLEKNVSHDIVKHRVPPSHTHLKVIEINSEQSDFG